MDHKMSPVRPFLENDIREVADLIWRVLHKRDGSSPSVFHSYLRQVFFHSPWYEEDLPSLVYQDPHGKIVGFLGVVPRRMLLRGKPVRVAFGSNFVVDPASRLPLASLHLARTFRSGKQDLTIADSANDLSRKILTGIGFDTAILQSIHWARPLRPSLYGLYGLSRLHPSRLGSHWATAIKPFCALVDAIAGRLPGSLLRPRVPKVFAKPADVEALLRCFREFSCSRSLVPDYDLVSLCWLLNLMSEMRAYGDLRKVILHDENQKIAGFYLYCVQAGSVAQVVRIGARNKFSGEILDHLLSDAWAQGAIGLHGRLDPQFMQGLSERHCLLYRRGDWVLIHSNQPELSRLVRSGDALLTRLEGEWCLKFGGGGGSSSS